MYSLEDKDRNLFSYMTEKEILSVKVKHETAIPYGNYKVTITYSDRFKRDMPLIVGVKGFDGIRIHNGSFVGDTDGCPLVGYKSGFLPNENAYWISESKDAFSEFMQIIGPAVGHSQNCLYLDHHGAGRHGRRAGGREL